MLYFAEILLSGINAACFRSLPPFIRRKAGIYYKIEDVLSKVSESLWSIGFLSIYIKMNKIMRHLSPVTIYVI